jgi:hypothetical protein
MDVARSLGDPIRFTPENSLDRSTERLSGDAQRRINLLALRLRAISLKGIEIEEMPGKHPTVAVNQDLALLKRLISEALEREVTIAKPRSNDDESGDCGSRLQPVIRLETRVTTASSAKETCCHCGLAGLGLPAIDGTSGRRRSANALVNANDGLVVDLLVDFSVSLILCVNGRVFPNPL